MPSPITYTQTHLVFAYGLFFQGALSTSRDGGVPPPPWSLGWPLSTEDFFPLTWLQFPLLYCSHYLPYFLCPLWEGVSSVFSLTTHQEPADSNEVCLRAFGLLWSRLGRPSWSGSSWMSCAWPTLGPPAQLTLVCPSLAPQSPELDTVLQTPLPLLNRGEKSFPSTWSIHQAKLPAFQYHRPIMLNPSIR